MGVRLRVIRAAAAAGMLCLSLLSAGCSSGPSPSGAGSPGPSLDSAVVEVISDGLATNLDDFSAQVLRQALETGQISEADWKQVNTNWIACVRGLGAEATIFYEGTRTTYQVAPPKGIGLGESAGVEFSEAVRQTCDLPINLYVNGAYDLLYRESWKSDPRQVDERVIACLQRAGVAPESLTYEEFEADLAAGEASRYGPGSSEAATACWRENS
jgi:hypothetical protein